MEFTQFSQFIQENYLYAALALISGSLLIYQTVQGRGLTISPQAATLMINREDALVIDVREPREWTAGHIPCARHIVRDQLDKRIREIERYKTRAIIVNCQNGVRSVMACNKLRKRGFEKVYNLEGGLDAWREAGLPVTEKN